MDKYCDFLMSVHLFSGINCPQAEAISAICEERRYAQDETIFEIQSPERELYLIYQGSVHIISPVPNTPAVELHPGDTIGDLSLVDDWKRGVSAKAASEQVILLRLSRSKLILLMNTYPDLGYRILNNLVAGLVRRLHATAPDTHPELYYFRKG
jgi:signal-transduction protein with cAMP-binding, CBS, and nucleotidyltransferase domain